MTVEELTDSIVDEILREPEVTEYIRVREELRTAVLAALDDARNGHMDVGRARAAMAIARFKSALEGLSVRQAGFRTA